MSVRRWISCFGQLGIVTKLITLYLSPLIGGYPACTKENDVGNMSTRPHRGLTLSPCPHTGGVTLTSSCPGTGDGHSRKGGKEEGREPGRETTEEDRARGRKGAEGRE
eukprot:3050909-Rhodomonas_salina.1